MRKSRFLTAAFAVVCLMLASSVYAAAQQQGAQPAVRTAAESYKNIQVLKTIPATQFIPTMRFISTALGVECEFCHMGDRSVDTEHKNTARKMMTMMMGINNAQFNGRTEVTCFTCHHGQNDPSNAPTPIGEYSALGAKVFFKPDGGAVANRDEVMSKAYEEYSAKSPLAGMPTADQILANYVTALGGEQAIRKVTSRIITGSTELAADVRGVGPTVHAATKLYSRAPNQWVMTLDSGPLGTTANGFDGNVAWIQAANGTVTETTGANNSALPPLARAKRNADFYEALNLKQQYPQLTLRGLTKVRDRDAYVLTGTPQGDSIERLYFDKESGLLVRKVTVVATALGNYPYQTDYDDYRPVGGVKIPYLISTVSISPADDMTIHVEKVEINPTVDASRFAKPASRPPAPARQ